MIENGMRLQVSVNDKSFVIIDTITDQRIYFDGNQYIKDDIPHINVNASLQGLVTLLCDNKIKRSWTTRPQTENSSLVITQLTYCSYNILYDKETASVLNGKTICSKRFNKESVLNTLAYVISILGRKGNTVLARNANTCRKLSDTGMFIIKGNKHVIALNDKNRSGNVLLNCLFDDIFFMFLYVDVHIEDKLVYIYNNELNLVSTFDYDPSFLVYFVEDSTVFKED